MNESNVDEAKGRAKEAAGSLTGDDDLKQEGKTDQAKADVKEKVNQAKDKAEDLIDGAGDKVNKLLGRDK